MSKLILVPMTLLMLIPLYVVLSDVINNQVYLLNSNQCKEFLLEERDIIMEIASENDYRLSVEGNYITICNL